MEDDEEQKEDIEMIINDDKKLESIIKEEINDDVSMSNEKPIPKSLETTANKTKSDTNLSVHKPKIKHQMSMTPSLNSNLKYKELIKERKVLPSKNNTTPLKSSKDKIMKSEISSVKNIKSSVEKIDKNRRSRNKSKSKHAQQVSIFEENSFVLSFRNQAKQTRQNLL